MTYGADFRPGMHTLPRHDAVKVPDIAEYETYLASLPLCGRKKGSLITAARLRRICQLCNSGATLNDTCRRLGEEYGKTRNLVRQMPQELLGREFFAHIHKRDGVT